MLLLREFLQSFLLRQIFFKGSLIYYVIIKVRENFMWKAQTNTTKPSSSCWSRLSLSVSQGKYKILTWFQFLILYFWKPPDHVDQDCDMFSKTNWIKFKNLFSRHFMYSFFFLRHSRAASRFFRSRISRFLIFIVIENLILVWIFTIFIFIFILIFIYLTGLICCPHHQDCLAQMSPGKTWRRGQRMGWKKVIIIVINVKQLVS